MPYTLIRSNRKTLSIQLTRTGEVVVHAPRLLARRRIEAFIEEKQDWIDASQQRIRARMQKYAPIRFAPGEAIPYLGGSLTLCFCADKKFSIRGNTLFCPQNAERDNLVKFLRTQIKELLQARAAFYSAQMGARFKSLRLSDAQARFGSCGAANSLNFAWRLVFFPIEQIDYIVVHELCHVQHKDHSAAFWAQVASVLPDYKARQYALRENQGLMQII